MLRGKHLNRRTILRGLGTAIGLPLFDAMVPALGRAATTASAAPCRMAFLYVPNGIMMDQWIPRTAPGTTPLPSELPRISACSSHFGMT